MNWCSTLRIILKPRLPRTAKVAYRMTCVPLACLGMGVSVWGQVSVSQPLSEDDVTFMLDTGESPTKIINTVQTRHIAFVVTPDIERELKGDPHNASAAVITALKQNDRNHYPPKPEKPTASVEAGSPTREPVSIQPIVQPTSSTNPRSLILQLLSGDWRRRSIFASCFRHLHLDSETHNGTYHFEGLDRRRQRCTVDYDLRLDHADEVEATFWGTVRTSNWSGECISDIGDTGGTAGARIILRAFVPERSAGVSLLDDFPVGSTSAAPLGTTEDVPRVLLAIHEPFIHSTWTTLIPSGTPGN
jgi:hypothetical protein